MESYQTSEEQDRAIREHAVLGAVDERAQIGVSGKDRASFLQGLLTNDVQTLAPGSGCYAAWLTPQGRMLTDLHVFESGDMMLLDVPVDQLEPTLQRLDQFLFGEDVQFASLAGRLRAVWLHGPSASRLLEEVISGVTGLAEWADYRNARAQFGDQPIVVARVDQLGVPGFCAYVDPAHAAALAAALEEAGAARAARDVIEAARIDARYPLFGIDMTDDTIPLEAGIEQRAISLSKGCYVGQEVIIRVLHRGHGRVARKLVRLTVAGEPPPSGAKLFAGDREIGFVTSAARSVRLGAIALGYVRRDALESRVTLEVQALTGRAAAALF